MYKFLLALVLFTSCQDNELEELYPEQNQFEEVEVIPTPPPVQTVSTIGDSRFISHGSSKLRYYINHKAKNRFTFVGSLTDKYNFGHDAVGGSNSQNLMNRYDDIPLADIYVIMFGTNDNDLQTSVDTISFIITHKLAQGSKVFYCAEIPRDDHGDGNHIARTEIITQMFEGTPGFEIIDLRTPMLNADLSINLNYYSDHVHNNDQGARVMAAQIAIAIK